MLRRLKNILWHYFFVATIVILMTPFLIGFATPKRIIIQYDDQEKTVSTTFTAAKAILEEANITLEQGDSYHFEEGHEDLEDGCVLTVARGVDFEVIYNGECRIFKSSKATVGAALKDVGVKFHREKIYPEKDAQLQPGMRIYVLAKDENLHLEEVTVEPETTYVDDHDLAEGLAELDNLGKPGRVQVVAKIVQDASGNDQIVEIGRIELESAENKVIRRGTALSVLTPEGFKRYSRMITCEATAYSGGGYTATGISPYRGVVAVDPQYIPLGTRMFIPGYGMAVAADTGGAMGPQLIDIYLETETECFYWGRRDVEVYLLEEE